jgi:hypothetical protein
VVKPELMIISSNMQQNLKFPTRMVRTKSPSVNLKKEKPGLPNLNVFLSTSKPDTYKNKTEIKESLSLLRPNLSVTSK